MDCSSSTSPCWTLWCCCNSDRRRDDEPLFCAINFLILMLGCASRATHEFADDCLDVAAKAWDEKEEEGVLKVQCALEEWVQKSFQRLLAKEVASRKKAVGHKQVPDVRRLFEGFPRHVGKNLLALEQQFAQLQIPHLPFNFPASLSRYYFFFVVRMEWEDTLRPLSGWMWARYIFVRVQH